MSSALQGSDAPAGTSTSLLVRNAASLLKGNVVGRCRLTPDGPRVEPGC